MYLNVIIKPLEIVICKDQSIKSYLRIPLKFTAMIYVNTLHYIITKYRSPLK